MKDSKSDLGTTAMFGVMLVAVGLIMVSQFARNRIEAIERIVGTETPASMTWTNGHVYSTIVKHSANCPCVKK